MKRARECKHRGVSGVLFVYARGNVRPGIRLAQVHLANSCVGLHTKFLCGGGGSYLGRGNGASGREGVWLGDSELHGKDLPRACLSLLPRHIGQGGRED